MRRLRGLRTCLALWPLLIAVLVQGCAGLPGGASVPSPTPAPRGDLLAEVRERGVLRIATDPNYLPQSFLQVDGRWQGFDVEIGRAVARRLGLKPEFIAVSFEQVTPGGWKGRWDVNIGSMTVTPERQRALIFSSPYYYTPAAFAVHADSRLHAVAELERRVVGVGAATTYLAYLGGTLTLADGDVLTAAPAVRVQVYETDVLALQDLAVGDGVRLDAVLTALPTIQSAMQHGEPIRPLAAPVYYEALAVALDRDGAQDAQPLADAISAIIAEMRADGTLRRISRQFYGVDLSTQQP